MMKLAHLQSSVLLSLVVSGCTAISGVIEPTVTPPALGDIWMRPADDMEMVFVPGGDYLMGSDPAMAKSARSLCSESCGDLAVAVCGAKAFSDEQPAHKVTLDGFWIDKTEVTNRQYQVCVEEGSCSQPQLNSSFTRINYYDDPAYADYPVINIDWNQAEKYCSWAGADLPTEAQWEYAARGPESLVFPWGNSFDKTRLNYCDAHCEGLNDASFNDYFPDTSPVGAFPNGAAWNGALDMAGNVREWVRDWYRYYPAEELQNPTGPETGESKIPRGGSWYDRPDDVRSTNRGGELPDYYRHNLGFRCARDDQETSTAFRSPASNLLQ